MIPPIFFYRLSSCEGIPLGDVEIAESFLVLLYHFSSASTGVNEIGWYLLK